RAERIVEVRPSRVAREVLDRCVEELRIGSDRRAQRPVEREERVDGDDEDQKPERHLRQHPAQRAPAEAHRPRDRTDGGRRCRRGGAHCSLTRTKVTYMTTKREMIRKIATLTAAP